ncbi:MAG: hypothetical protein WCA39_10635 [Nitrososphaeraceae archaeon]
MTLEFARNIWVVGILLFYIISSKNYILKVDALVRMFGRGKIKPGNYVFVVQNDHEVNTIIIGKVQSVDGDRLKINGTKIRPVGLLERVKAGRAIGRPKEVLENPDPNNCIFMLIDRVETQIFSEEVDQKSSKAIWINERRYYVLDGWIKENLPDIFASVLSAAGDEKLEARAMLLEKMNSIYEKDLKEHLYAVARSTRVL